MMMIMLGGLIEEHEIYNLIDQVEIMNVQNMLLDALRYENLITF